jgi:hypothetical protein
MNYPILYVAVVNIFNFIVYISVPIIVRYLILRKPLTNKGLAIGTLLTIFIVFSTVTYRLSSAEIMGFYLSNLNDSFITEYGTGLTDKEQEHYRKQFTANASNYGLWETIPAAVIQRQEIQTKIYQDHNISYKPRPRKFGSPVLLCLAMALSYFILLKGRRSSATGSGFSSDHPGRASDSKIIEGNNFKPVCPNCKTEIFKDSVYCHKCGNKITEAYEAKQS